ncbi:MAG: DUF3971 domain-containing protein [Halioglobus sp.]|nr:DUF3971 domain-containing protein [Halioglobus sp.]
MESSFFHKLSSLLWRALVLLVVVLAVYVSAGRMLVANLTPWRTVILQELNARVPFTVEAQQVDGQWQSFSPVIVLTGLRLTFPGSSDAPLELSQGRIGLDVLNSLRTASLQMTQLELTELSLRGELSQGGKLQLTGFGGSDDGTLEELREFLLNVERVTLKNNLLKLTMPGGEVRELDLDLVLFRDGSRRHVQASLISTTGTHIAIIADGIGDPFRPELFAGEAYLDIHSSDMGAVREILAIPNLPVWVEGALDLKLWFEWDKGQPTVEAQLEGRDLLIAGPDSEWEVPLDSVALQARLVAQGNLWTAFASDIHVAKDDMKFSLSRMQLDAWDNVLRVRASDVRLEPLSAILTTLDAMPSTLREVLATLQPRGRLSALQLGIGDMRDPSKDWTLEVNFEELGVDPFKGAPGISSATGYSRLTTNSGIVQLDSQSLTLDFPTIYHQLLHFEDMYGTLYLDWDADTVRLTSGVLTTQGEEGMAKVVLGLNVPVAPDAADDEVGIEMDLLVGLQDAHPVHRVKYIPYGLNTGLLNWLSDSIGEGRIEQGAFLWRGSLTKDAAPRRTVQLAFNVADTQLKYHPQWPSVVVERGTVLINDSAVSVWADKARLFESVAENLSVETRLNALGQIALEIEANVLGSAADGLRVLNESPLADIIGPTFSAWTMDGDLETDLQIYLNLSDKSVAPQVNVKTRWRDVNLAVNPGNLPIRAVTGEFNYSTTAGFSSDGLHGELWGKPLSVLLQQHHSAQLKRYDPARTVLDIALAAQVDMQDVRDWLALSPLGFVSGQTTAEVGIQLVPGEPPLLTVDSELQGVSLDLPEPWNKRKNEARQMHLQMPLVSSGGPILLDLEQQLNLTLDIADGVLLSGALGFNVEPPLAEKGSIRVSGHAPLIQADQWIKFVQTYFGVGSLSFPMKPNITPLSSAAAVMDAGTDLTQMPGMQFDPGHAGGPVAPIGIVIEEVRADTLVLLEQELRDVVFSLTTSRLGSSLSLHTDWLRGDLSLAADGSSTQVDIQHLDISRFGEFDLAAGDIGTVQDFSVVDVNLLNLFQETERVGELSFELLGEDGELVARNITGEFAHLRLRAGRAGRLVWHPGSEGFSGLQANLGFEDLGLTLEYFGYQRIVETEAGDFALNLQWPGPPQNFSMEALEGSMGVAIGPGSFPEAPSGAAGAVRVVSILNLADIVQRLSLTDTFDSGIPFYSVDGEIYFHSGVVEVARMDVQGGSSFQFSGVSDLQTQSLDGELVATLPIARNLPWIAALAASLPVAAGVFLVSKIFDKQMNRLSSAVYSIDGSWSDPQVRFDRVFDDTHKLPAKAPVEAAVQAESATLAADRAETMPPQATVDVHAPAQSVFP